LGSGNKAKYLIRPDPGGVGIVLASVMRVITSVVTRSARLSRRPDSAGLTDYLAKVRKVRPLGPEEERGLARRVCRMRDRAAARRLVTGHLGKVVRIAWQYRRRHPSLLELIQEGNLALVRAIWRYDPERSGRLSTYVGAWIRTCIARFVAEGHERRAAAGAAAERARAAVAVDEGPLLALEESALRGRLTALLPGFAERLPQREVGILRDRVLRDPPRTLAEQARELGITAERVRQIEVSLVDRLRALLLSTERSWMDGD
jgi:RNA polymerase sigma factor (sigma-70 family)